MTLKACIECGEPSDKSRCPQHRPKDTKPTAATRGYDRTWRKLSERARRLQPWCGDCGSTEDLQCDHSPQAWQRKAERKRIRLTDVDVVCGTCNRARGSQPGPGEMPLRRPAATPGARQSFSHSPDDVFTSFPRRARTVS